MLYLVKLLLPIFTCLQSPIIALGSSIPELFDSNSENYLFREPSYDERFTDRLNFLSVEEINNHIIPRIINIDEFESLIASIEDPEKQMEILQSSAYGNFLRTIEALNIITQKKAFYQLTGRLNFLNEREKIEAVFKHEFTTAYIDSLASLELHFPASINNHLRESSASTLAGYLVESVIWEVINEESMRMIKQIVKYKTIPHIWERLKKDTFSQISYYIKNQKVNGVKNPRTISTDIIIGDYQIIHIFELYKGYRKRIQEIVEHASSNYAIKKISSTIRNRIGETDRTEFEQIFRSSWHHITRDIRNDLKHKIVDLFILSDMHNLLNFSHFEISWDAFHGNLTGEIENLIDYTHLAFVWVGLIVYRSEQFSQLQKDLAKSIEQVLTNDEIEEIITKDLDRILHEIKSFAFPRLLSTMQRSYGSPL